MRQSIAAFEHRNYLAPDLRSAISIILWVAPPEIRLRELEVCQRVKRVCVIVGRAELSTTDPKAAEAYGYQTELGRGLAELQAGSTDGDHDSAASSGIDSASVRP